MELNNVKLTKEVIQETHDVIYKLTCNLRNQVRNEMKERKELIIPSDICDYDVSTSISYDGGNHPEYASDCFAQIESIEWSEKCDDVVIHTEHGDMYICDCNVDDVFTIAELVLFLITEYPQKS